MSKRRQRPGPEKTAISEPPPDDIFKSDADSAIETSAAFAQMYEEPSEAAKDDLKHALVRTPDGTMRFRSFTLSAIGLDPKKHVGYIHENDWEELGNVLFDIKKSVQWIIGDWIRYGEIEYSKTYEEIAAQTGREKTTLYQYKWVAENVEFSIRIENLSFGHHQLVASFKDENDEPDTEMQKFWLSEAAENDWSVARLRAEIKNVNSTESHASTLADKHHKQTFGRVFRALERGQNAKHKDVEALKKWLQEVETSHVDYEE